MEYKKENSIKDELAEPNPPKMEGKDVVKQELGSSENSLVNTDVSKDGSSVQHGATLGNTGSPGEVNMEASIASNDVIQAGGFGARDDISSFLPVASDFTDFEASLRNARDYEEPEAATHRPGLGWTEATDSK
ncbi:uncharacterized protein LOC131152929 isoform X2 [Malania oleifera]|uniref:uncharacterized protein LOC131152929 isoform X2 n=1 Tax=Malania oleifera TaxID=397392 RepID=UPI0025AEB78D|nr:uncharacterized protein LOC131152929 isoform X2 [Malania oleifera]